MALATAAHHSSQRVSSASTQTEYVAPLPVTEYVAPALSSSTVFDAAPAPVTYHVAPAPADSYATPATVNAYVAPAPVTTRFTLSVDTTAFVKSQFSITAVEASASQVVDSFPCVNESALHVYNLVHQEQITAEQESVERVQQHTIEQIVHVPSPQIHQQMMGNVQVIPRQLFPERLEEQIVDILVPPFVEEIAEVVQFIPLERFLQRTVEQIVGAPVPQVVEEQLVAEETIQNPRKILK